MPDPLDEIPAHDAAPPEAGFESDKSVETALAEQVERGRTESETAQKPKPSDPEVQRHMEAQQKADEAFLEVTKKQIENDEQRRRPVSNIPFANPPEWWNRRDRMERDTFIHGRPNPEDVAEEAAEKERYQRKLAEAFERKRKEMEAEFAQPEKGRAKPGAGRDPEAAPLARSPDPPIRPRSLAQELQDEVESAFPVENQSAVNPEAPSHLFSWGTISVMVSLLLATGIGVLALRESDDFIVAKVCFCLVWLILGAKIVYSATRAKRRSAFMTFLLVFLGCGVMGVAALASVNYVNRKRDAALAKSRSESLASTNRANQTAVPEDVLRKLAEHMNEGSQILNELIDRRTPGDSRSKADDWSEKVEKYLNDKGLKVYELRFKNSMIITYPHGRATSRTRPLVNWLYTRIKRLEEFIRELGQN
jgi:hypothetical protein